jgi:hypothetical protein
MLRKGNFFRGSSLKQWHNLLKRKFFCKRLKEAEKILFVSYLIFKGEFLGAHKNVTIWDDIKIVFGARLELEKEQYVEVGAWNVIDNFPICKFQ